MLPVALVGFQGAWEGTVTGLTIVGSIVLVVAACLAAHRTVREQGASWRLPAVGIIVVGLASYGVM
jgi:hypothetical protein